MKTGARPPLFLRRASPRTLRVLGRLAGAGRVQLRDATTVLDGAERRLTARAPRALAEAGRAVDAMEARVRALDPARVLARGWSITTTADGAVVRSPDDVAPGDALVTRLAGGEVRSTVDGDG